jgi:protein involved in ribonucleotide reduction
MLIVYDSFTGNVKRFVEKLGLPNIKIYDGLIVSEPYVLITYTAKFGEVPDSVSNFLKENHSNMVGVCASGRQIWKLQGTYCKSADIIHNQYRVPILLKFEMMGTDKDRQELLERIENIEQQKLY